MGRQSNNEEGVKCAKYGRQFWGHSMGARESPTACCKAGDCSFCRWTWQDSCAVVRHQRPAGMARPMPPKPPLTRTQSHHLLHQCGHLRPRCCCRRRCSPPKAPTPCLASSPGHPARFLDLALPRWLLQLTVVCCQHARRRCLAVPHAAWGRLARCRQAQGVQPLPPLLRHLQELLECLGNAQAA